MVGCLTPERDPSSVSDGEDSKIMVFPVWFEQLWGPDPLWQILRAAQIGKAGDHPPPPRHGSPRRPTAPEPELPLSFLF